MMRDVTHSLTHARTHARTHALTHSLTRAHYAGWRVGQQCDPSTSAGLSP